MMLGFDTARDAASSMIAALHPADIRCRPQIVNDDESSGIAEILTGYHRITGEGVLLSTSLNLHGEPIARTAHDAMRIMLGSNLTHMQIGDFTHRQVDPKRTAPRRLDS